MSENYCKYCHRYFRFKDLYEQHNITCEFFHKKARERDRENDLLETLPSPQDQFHLIQHLMVQVTRLKKQVERLQQNNIVKKKKMISEYLNSEGFTKPSICFEEWIKNLPTSFDNLNHVFEGDLTDGVLDVFYKAISRDTDVPFLAFNQKQNSFYIYTYDASQETSCWRILTHEEYVKAFNRIGHKLLQEFIRWQKEFKEENAHNEEAKEANILYMYKINGCGVSYEDRRKSESKRILYEKIAQDFTQNVVYEYL